MLKKYAIPTIFPGQIARIVHLSKYNINNFFIGTIYQIRRVICGINGRRSPSVRPSEEARPHRHLSSVAEPWPFFIINKNVCQCRTGRPAIPMSLWPIIKFYKISVLYGRIWMDMPSWVIFVVVGVIIYLFDDRISYFICGPRDAKKSIRQRPAELYGLRSYIIKLADMERPTRLMFLRASFLSTHNKMTIRPTDRRRRGQSMYLLRWQKTARTNYFPQLDMLANQTVYLGGQAQKEGIR